MNLHYSLLQCLGRAQCIVLVHSHCRLFIPTSQITTWESLNRRFDGHNLFLRTHTLFSHLRDIVDGFSHGKMIIGTFQIWVLHVFFSFFCCCSYWTSYFFLGGCIVEAERGAQDDNHPERHNYMVLNPQSGAGPTVESVSGSLEETWKLKELENDQTDFKKHMNIYEICIYIFLYAHIFFHYD